MTCGNPRQFYKKYLFEVRWINPASGAEEAASFQKISELSAEVGKVEHWEGGRMRPYKEPGRVTYTDLTLERGVTSENSLYRWFQQVVTNAAQSGNPTPEFCADIQIYQLDRNGAKLRHWQVFGAWPTKFVAGEWDNTSEENVIESLTLCYDYFEMDEASAASDLTLVPA
jgi:phage tail-like protein